MAPGSLVRYVVADAALVLPKPKQIGFAEAAAFPAGIFNRRFCAEHESAGCKRGERLLIHAAAGGVGQAAIQLAQPSRR